MNRAGKRMFRQVARQLNAPETPLSDAQTDLICDYVEARLRIASLADMLGADIAEASGFNVDKARIIALSRQIDATTALSHKIADKLGLEGYHEQFQRLGAIPSRKIFRVVDDPRGKRQNNKDG
jgi:hypothetical protein